VLDEMEEVQEVNCTSNRLFIAITPGSDVDLMSRQFQLGNVVSGGIEWGCQSAFNRKIRSVSISTGRHPPFIVLDTIDCSPFEAFANQDIEMWSENAMQSGSNVRAHKAVDLFANAKISQKLLDHPTIPPL